MSSAIPDTDNDDPISKAEYNCSSRAAFSRLDQDCDGKLTWAEYDLDFDIVNTDGDCFITVVEFN